MAVSLFSVKAVNRDRSYLKDLPDAYEHHDVDDVFLSVYKHFSLRIGDGERAFEKDCMTNFEAVHFEEGVQVLRTEKRRCDAQRERREFRHGRILGVHLQVLSYH